MDLFPRLKGEGPTWQKLTPWGPLPSRKHSPITPVVFNLCLYPPSPLLKCAASWKPSQSQVSVAGSPRPGLPSCPDMLAVPFFPFSCLELSPTRLRHFCPLGSEKADNNVGRFPDLGLRNLPLTACEGRVCECHTGVPDWSSFHFKSSVSSASA